MIKETWEGVTSSPLSLGKKTVDFLQDLQTRLETVHTYTENHGANAQQRYVDRYNLRAREKHFEMRDQVLLLAPDDTSRTFSRWRGPAQIVEVRSPHSYIIELDGVLSLIHI